MGTEALQRDAVSLEEIVERDPTSALYLPQAERLLRRGRVAEAIRLCEERRARPGRGVGDHIVLGRCYLADGRLLEARREFEGALELDRENVVALKSLAGIFSHEGRHAEAADLYRAVCRVDPGDLECQTALHQITSGDFPEVRPAEIVVDHETLTWQPIRLAREEDHLRELALGLRTLEPHEAESLRPSEAPEGAGPSADAPLAPLAPHDLELSTDVRAAVGGEGPAAGSSARRGDSSDAFQERLGGLDVEAFQDSALERLETALRPVPVRVLGEVEPAAPVAEPPAAVPPAETPEPPAVPAPSAPPAPAASVPARAVAKPAPDVPESPAPEERSAAKGNRAAFEMWLRNLGGGGTGGAGS